MIRKQINLLLFAASVLFPLFSFPHQGSCAEIQPVVTSLAKLEALFKSHSRVDTSLDLVGTILSINATNQTLVLQNPPNIQLFNISGMSTTFKAGDAVRLTTEPCRLIRTDYGILIESLPLIEDTATNSTPEAKGSIYLPRGQFPLRLSWIGTTTNSSVEVLWAGPGIEKQRIAARSLLLPGSNQTATHSSASSPGISYECFEESFTHFTPGHYNRLPVKTGVAAIFTAEVRPRLKDMAVDYRALLAIENAGNYTFFIRGGGLAEMSISTLAPQMAKLISATQPLPDDPEISSDHPVWSSMTGQISFVSERAGGWDMEIVNGKRRVRAIVVDNSARVFESAGVSVTIHGIRLPSSHSDSLFETIWVVPGWESVQPSADPGTDGSVSSRIIESVLQIRKLNSPEALSSRSVKITGVITCLKAESGAVVIQDSSAGIEIHGFLDKASSIPVIGEIWQVEGVTTFAENGSLVVASAVTRLGVGLLPDPVRPSWDQLMNGSLDGQYGELQGIITDIRRGTLGLLTSAGRIRLQLNSSRAEELKSYRNKLVRIRGCIFAVWHPQTHRIKSGELSLIDPAVTVDQESVADPFSLPVRHVADLLGFESRNGQLERSRVSGQLLHEWAGEYYLQEGTNGLRFTTEARLGLELGDMVDVVGYPAPGGTSLIMREPVVQKTGHAALPNPTHLDLTRVLAKGYDATLVQVEGLLVNTIEGDREDELEVQAGFRTFVAKLRSNDGVRPALEIGSRLQLTGVYSSLANNGVPALGIDTFELLLNSTSNIRVLSRPPWWTLNKLLSILGMFATVLLIAFVWIGQLRRRVALRTAEVEQQIKARQRLEQQQAMEQERARVAHDLHDELGAGLTEVGILGSLAKNSAIPADKKERYLNQLTDMSRQLVTTLDEIVWAINPKYDSVSSLGSYFCLYAQRFLELASVSCRLDIPEALPSIPLESKVRHSVFLAFKESLNNVVKHAAATEVHLAMRVEKNTLSIVVADDGKGFKLSDTVPGLDGLLSMKNRFSTLGGDCLISSSPGKGTVITFTLPMK